MDINTEEFISAVQHRTAIWQSKHLQHLNRKVINKLWEEIKQLFPGSNDKQLRKKWKNLRDHFRKELKKFPPARSGDPGDTLQSTWPYFQQMLFIKDDLTAEQSSGNLDAVTHNISQDHADTDDSSVITDVTDTISQSSSGSKKRKCASDYREQFIELENKKIVLLQIKLSQATTSSNDGEEKCEDYYFFKSLIPQMRAFPPLQKLRVKNKIMQLLMAETEKLEYERRYDSYGFNTQSNMDFNPYNNMDRQ
ncbi:unnamed protein product [Parnassius apollo]|uniref:(apollo) hypothetical protein n=1 Tax=Parnassius apollo TaxID=110799 RepID=A0A8S3YDQ4_PARAO|nr:unnamed protein product [Parnassius apollo]